MTKSKLRLVSFGCARALTRDMLIGDETEIEVGDSRNPAV